MHDKEQMAVWIVVFAAIGVLGYFTTMTIFKLQELQASYGTNESLPVDVSGWLTYQNPDYGFEIEYPATWQIATGGLTSQTPYLILGNPIDGTTTYQLDIFIEGNPSMLSSGSYVHSMLDAARAQDQANATVASMTPPTAPTYDRAYVLNVGGYPAYELDNVFEFDHNAERIYVAHNTETLRFDFPIQKENPNIWLPVANGQVAHNIINTLVFTR